jgi:type II secretory pathway pseudopilin PulG
VIKIVKLAVLAALLLTGIQAGTAQETKPIGFFLKDSVKIGEPVPYVFSYKDKKNRTVIFPDSLFDFTPFELISKEYFNTRSDTTNSIDSAVYYLSTFEIDTVQRLALPVFLIIGSDSIPNYSLIDSIILDQVVTQMPDSVAMEENSFYRPVSLEFNYPYAIIALIILGVVALIVLIVWGKEIRKRIRLYRLKKSLEKFRMGFDAQIEALARDTTKPNIEKTLVYWKKYMEGIEDLPFTKLTTKEIVLLMQSSSLNETLKSIDKNIYSKATVSTLQNDFEFLKDYSQDRYNHITEVIKNG